MTGMREFTKTTKTTRKSQNSDRGHDPQVGSLNLMIQNIYAMLLCYS